MYFESLKLMQKTLASSTENLRSENEETFKVTSLNFNVPSFCLVWATRIGNLFRHHRLWKSDNNPGFDETFS